MSDKRARKQERRARKRKAQRTHQPSGQQILLTRAQKSDYLKDARDKLIATFDMLLARKRRYFTNNTRVILDYQITDSADTLHLDVISTVGKAYHPPR